MDSLELECISGDNAALLLVDLGDDGGGPRVLADIKARQAFLGLDDVVALRDWASAWLKKHGVNS